MNLIDAAKQARKRQIASTRVMSKMAVGTLGVAVEYTPEETQIMAIDAELPPIADGVEWKPGLNLVGGTIIVRNGGNYKVLQGHISQAGWEPENVPALFAVIKEDFAEWEQPDSTNPYMTGDKVMYQGKKYESLIDGNVWSPTAYPAGWKEIE